MPGGRAGSIGEPLDTWPFDLVHGSRRPSFIDKSFHHIRPARSSALHKTTRAGARPPRSGPRRTPRRRARRSRGRTTGPAECQRPVRPGRRPGTRPRAAGRDAPTAPPERPGRHPSHGHSAWAPRPPGASPRETPEVPGHAVLHDVPAGTEQAGSGRELPAQAEQVSLIATRSMQQEQRQG